MSSDHNAGSSTLFKYNKLARHYAQRETATREGSLRALDEHCLAHPEEVSAELAGHEDLDRHRAACDFIAGMTDPYAVMTYERLFLPQQWSIP